MKILRPHFELKYVEEDGTEGEAQIVPVPQLPLELRTNRRAFLNTGIAVSAVVALINNGTLKRDAAFKLRQIS